MGLARTLNRRYFRVLDTNFSKSTNKSTSKRRVEEEEGGGVSPEDQYSPAETYRLISSVENTENT